MGKIEALQKSIDQIADKVRHLRYILILLMSSIIGLIFGISQKNIAENALTNTLLIFGTMIFVLIGIMIKKEEDKRNKLIIELEITKD